MKQVIGGFEDVLETAQGATQSAVKSAQKSATNFGKTAASQVTGAQVTQDPQNSANEQASAQTQQMSDDQAKKFLQDLYGPTKPANSAPQNTPQNPVAAAVGVSQSDPNKGKSPEDLAKIEVLKKELHNDYYQNLVNPPKKAEESITEKLEREDQEEKFEEIEKQKEQPDPLPAGVKQGTGESVVGVSG